jgi:hypothetical protein
MQAKQEEPATAAVEYKFSTPDQLHKKLIAKQLEYIEDNLSQAILKLHREAKVIVTVRMHRQIIMDVLRKQGWNITSVSDATSSFDVSLASFLTSNDTESTRPKKKPRFS